MTKLQKETVHAKMEVNQITNYKFMYVQKCQNEFTVSLLCPVVVL